MPHKKITNITELDIVNKKIINVLKKDAKTPYKQIADELEISESTVRKRINTLVESNVIEKFTIDINPEYAKQNITAFITLIPNEGKQNDLIEYIIKQSYCSEVFVLNGKMGILMIAGTENGQELDALLETYRIHPDIKEVISGISLRNIKTGNCVAKLF